jgi:hypothetical protein
MNTRSARGDLLGSNVVVAEDEVAEDLGELRTSLMHMTAADTMLKMTDHPQCG